MQGLPQFAGPFTDWWARGGACALAAVNTGVRTSPHDPALRSFGRAPRSGSARSYGHSVFNFSRNLHRIPCSGCPSLYGF